jgi:WD40 repeat protein
MTAIRFCQDASVLNDGTVLLTGGSDGNNRALDSAEIYDPAAGTFAITGSMLFLRVWHTSTLLPNGKVLVTGGADNSSAPVATAELYQ